jgi:Flp pilus assembly protein TadD
VDTLSRNLRTLAANPRSMTALMGAGQAALRLGDGQAALTFFARAEELAPRDGRIKMWMGSALVQLEQARGALKFFKDATDLGVAEADVARDRGLAYDISGDPRRAQRDYRLALQAGSDPEVTRRLALSLAITGDRDAALRLLEPQLTSGDRAAERTRALVLALVGDMAGAGRVVQASMPGGQGEAMMPFLARLPSLSYADRALAVHLGHFPNDGRTASPSVYAANRMSQPDAMARRGSAGLPTDAGRPDPAQDLLQRRIAGAQRPQPPQSTQSTQSTAPARIATATTPSGPGHGAAPAVRKERGLAPPVSAWSWSRGIEPTRPLPVHQPSRTAAAQPQPKPREAAADTAAEAAAQRPAQARRDPTPLITADSDPAPDAARTPGPTPPSTAPAGEPIRIAVVAAADPAPLKPGLGSAAPQPSQTVADEPRRSSRLADLAATVAKIGDSTSSPTAARRTAPAATAPARPAVGEPRAAGKAAAGTDAAETKAGRAAVAAATKPTPPRKPEAGPREPSRIWVQVAGGADRALFPGEFARLKAKAPKLLGGRGAWAAKLNATNRLLVGPFADAEAAQDFVNALRKAELSAFAWTSEAGEKVEKLPAK